MRLPWIIQLGPKCHHESPYKREAKKNNTDTEKTDRDWSDVAGSPECQGHQKLEEVRGRIFLERAWPCWISDFQPPEH